MTFIKLTNCHNRTSPKSVYVNIEQIGHMYQVTKKIEYSNPEQNFTHTILGVTTHNNGGFDILETPEEILELIKKANKK
jgi:hypothetical protein